LLSKLHNSIVALGVTKPGQIAGKAANVVEKIVKGKYVDFVTQAGAGGHALELYESLGPDWELLTIEQLKQKRPDLLVERETIMPDDTVLQELKEGLTATRNEIEALRSDQAKEVQEARKEAVKLMVEGSKLPTKAQERIMAQLGETVPDDYKTRITQLIEAEKAYLTELTGGVVSLGQSDSAMSVINTISLEEYDKAAREIDLKYGLVRG
jgi:vacuolar-type H+-ATPase subunit H